MDKSGFNVETCLLKYASLPELGTPSLQSTGMFCDEQMQFCSQSLSLCFGNCTGEGSSGRKHVSSKLSSLGRLHPPRYRTSENSWRKSESNTPTSQNSNTITSLCPKDAVLVTKPTRLMELVQLGEKNFALDDSTRPLLMHKCSEAIELQSVSFPGDTLVIQGATALMIAAYCGNVKAVKNLLPEAGLTSDEGWSALMLAATEGHRQCVKLLHEEINVGNFTMLMFAVACNDYDRVRILMHMAGKQFSLRADRGLSALMLAVKLCHYEIAALLIPREKNLQTTNDWIVDQTALLLAIRYAASDDCSSTLYHTVLTALLKEEGNIRNERGETPLILAAGKGNIVLARFICDNTAEWSPKLRAQTYEGETALMYAARNGHLDACTYLLDYEARLATNEGKTALMFASEKGHSDVVRALCTAEAGLVMTGMLFQGKTALMFAAEYGHVSTALILAPVECGMTMADGTTALMIAAMNNCSSVLPLLQHEAGAQDNHGRSALIHAARSGSAESVEVLASLESGMQDRHGNTALMHAVRNGDVRITSLLLYKELNISNMDGCTALMLAAEQGNRELSELLRGEVSVAGFTNLMLAVATGKGPAEVSQHIHEQGRTASNGMTSLILAAICNNVSVIEALLPEAGQCDTTGNTALMHACMHGFKEVAAVLLDHESGRKNRDGMTALMLAIYYGHTDCVKLLLDKEGNPTDSERNDITLYARYPNHDNAVSRAEIISLLTGLMNIT